MSVVLLFSPFPCSLLQSTQLHKIYIIIFILTLKEYQSHLQKDFAILKTNENDRLNNLYNPLLTFKKIYLHQWPCSDIQKWKKLMILHVVTFKLIA